MTHARTRYWDLAVEHVLRLLPNVLAGVGMRQCRISGRDHMLHTAMLFLLVLLSQQPDGTESEGLKTRLGVKT
jgi:hypothetical protein